jgi:hypothetical protein
VGDRTAWLASPAGPAWHSSSNSGSIGRHRNDSDAGRASTDPLVVTASNHLERTSCRSREGGITSLTK